MAGHIISRIDGRLLVMEAANPLPQPILQGHAITTNGTIKVNMTQNDSDIILGFAFRDQATPGGTVEVYLSGVVWVPYTGTAPAVTGDSGVEASNTPGVVEAPGLGAGFGTAILVDAPNNLVLLRFG